MMRHGRTGTVDSTALAAALALALVVGGCTDDDQGPAADVAVADAAQDAGVDVGATDAAIDADAAAPDAAGKSGKLVILHTNDLHSTVEGWRPVADYTPLTTGDDSTVGGFARLATAVTDARAAAGDTPVLLLDAGDFSMGSPFDMLATSRSPMLVLMDRIGYDAIVLGNHEFEGSPALTAAMIDAAWQAGARVPLLLSNLKFDPQDAADDALEALFQAGSVSSKLVIELDNGLKVGIFGLLGEKAWDVAYGPGPLTIEDPADAARAMVAELRQQDRVDLVVCLSHSGLREDGTGPDADLAQKVAGIDVIVGGHSHTLLAQPVVVGETIIVQAGSHGEHLGRLELEVLSGKVEVGEYELIPIDDAIAGSAEVQTEVVGYVADIDALLAPDLSYAEVIAETAFDLGSGSFVETPVGNLITDAYRHAVAQLDPTDPPALALDSMGVIGDPIDKGQSGKIILADVYRAVKAGYGPDGASGFPLVSVYLHGKDLKDAMEVLAHAEDMLKSKDYFFQISGMRVEYSRSGGVFDRVTSIEAGDPPVAVDLEDTAQCYRVVTNLLVALWVTRVESASYGLLSVEPKEKDCQTLVTDMYERIIDADPAAPGVQELKAWRAVVDYLGSLPDTDGDLVPDVPASYATVQGRIVASP